MPVAAVALLGALAAACSAQHETADVSGELASCQTALALSGADASADAMVLIEGGSFIQGARGLHPEEGPPRETEIGPFWIDRTEVTNAAFARFVKATGYRTLAERPLDPARYPGLSADQRSPSGIVFVGDSGLASGPGGWWRVVPGADWRQPEGPGSSLSGREHHPVVQIAYDDALAYARWLGHDLPTESEWEFAARGGLAGKTFVWGDAPLDPERPQANVWQGLFPVMDTGRDGYKARTAPVGCFPANAFGLYDMAGNVWEWTKDWYTPSLNPAQAAPPVETAEAEAVDGDAFGERRRVIKGGSFLCADNYCLRYRPPAREAGPPDTGSSHVGFRTVRRPSAS